MNIFKLKMVCKYISNFRKITHVIHDLKFTFLMKFYTKIKCLTMFLLIDQLEFNFLLVIVIKHCPTLASAMKPFSQELDI